MYACKNLNLPIEAWYYRPKVDSAVYWKSETIQNISNYCLQVHFPNFYCDCDIDWSRRTRQIVLIFDVPQVIIVFNFFLLIIRNYVLKYYALVENKLFYMTTDKMVTYTKLCWRIWNCLQFIFNRIWHKSSAVAINFKGCILSFQFKICVV